MDLKDVVSGVYANAAEAHAAFHAGHHDISENYLKSVKIQVEQYLDEKTMPAGGVTESPTSETDVESQKETPAEAPGSKSIPASVAAGAGARSVGTGAAEPKQPQ